MTTAKSFPLPLDTSIAKFRMSWDFATSFVLTDNLWNDARKSLSVIPVANCVLLMYSSVAAIWASVAPVAAFNAPANLTWAASSSIADLTPSIPILTA